MIAGSYEVTFNDDGVGLVSLLGVVEDATTPFKAGYAGFAHLGHVNHLWEVDPLLAEHSLVRGGWSYDAKGTPPFYWAPAVPS